MKADKKNNSSNFSRRSFLSMSAAALAVPLLDNPISRMTTQIVNPVSKTKSSRKFSDKHNILFVFTDQEHYFHSLPKGLNLPGHERLKRTGVSFTNHYCPAVMCTSSRAVLLTGLQTPDNKMFENADMSYVQPLSTEIPTIGHMLKKAGYYSAYKGKWHLNKEFEREEMDRLFTKEMEAYGFSDFACPGDVIGHTLGGYVFDHLISGSAISWLRRKGQPLNDEGKPWSLFVSMVNPHDIMYYNTDLPGQKVQDPGNLLMHTSVTPDNEFFRKTSDITLPKSLGERLDAPERPKAHAEFLKSWGYTLGTIPLEEDRWMRFNNFYLNSLRLVDLQVLNILNELDAVGLSDNTIIVFTSDHGEMAGAHGLRGKGPFAYQEAIHLPLYIVSPDVKGEQECKALTGHIDLVPTILDMAGVNPDKAGELAGRDLPGKVLSPLLNNPGSAEINSIRDSVLFTYSGIATNDSELIKIVSEAKSSGLNPKEALVKSGYKPNLKKRGSLRSVFDGRYKMTRYFAPVERNQPKNIEDLYKWNDVELFDLKTDPEEMKNLAADRSTNGELIMQMSSKLEKVIKDEIGADDGREMPDFQGINWAINRMDL